MVISFLIYVKKLKISKFMNEKLKNTISGVIKNHKIIYGKKMIF